MTYVFPVVVLLVGIDGLLQSQGKAGLVERLFAHQAPEVRRWSSTAYYAATSAFLLYYGWRLSSNSAV